MFAVIYVHSTIPYVVFLTTEKLHADSVTAAAAWDLIHMGKHETKYIQIDDSTYLIIRLD